MIVHAWRRTLSGLANFQDIIDYELRPWRDSIAPDCHAWSLTMSPESLTVTSEDEGPFGWTELAKWSVPEVLPYSSPLDPLLHNLAADLTLTIAMGAMDTWAEAVDMIQTWPHRRRWRNRGGSRSFRRTRTTQPPPRSPVEPAINAAFGVLGIAADALPPFIAVDVEPTWAQLARHIRAQLAALNPNLAELSLADR